MTHLTHLFGMFAALFAAAAPANAAVVLDDYLGRTEGEIAAALESRGYVVEGFETEGDTIEVEANIDGTTYEMHIDRATGKLLSIEQDD